MKSKSMSVINISKTPVRVEFDGLPSASNPEIDARNDLARKKRIH